MLARRAFVIEYTENILLFNGAYFTNSGNCDKICNMKSYVSFFNACRAGCAAMRRVLAFCVVLTCLLSVSALAFEIPGNVTRIEEGAFIGDTALKTVEIPESVTFIGEEAFADCTNLTTIKIYGKNITFGDNALGRLGENRTIIGHDGTNVEEYANLYEFTFQPIVTKAAKLLAYADTLVGRSYSEMDCVGFVNKCYRDALGMYPGASTTNDIADDWREGLANYGELDQSNKNAVKITKISDLRPGDIICWSNDEVDYCTHVGIYVGEGVINGKKYTSGVFIDSSSGAKSVGYRLIPVTGSGYYTRNFMFAWRLI